MYTYNIKPGVISYQTEREGYQMVNELYIFLAIVLLIGIVAHSAVLIITLKGQNKTQANFGKMAKICKVWRTVDTKTRQFYVVQRVIDRTYHKIAEGFVESLKDATGYETLESALEVAAAEGFTEVLVNARE